MSAIKSNFARLHRDKRGATMVEYSVLVGLITILLVGVIGTVGGQIQDNWDALSLALTP